MKHVLPISFSHVFLREPTSDTIASVIPNFQTSSFEEHPPFLPSSALSPAHVNPPAAVFRVGSVHRREIVLAGVHDVLRAVGHGVPAIQGEFPSPPLRDTEGKPAVSQSVKTLRCCFNGVGSFSLFFFLSLLAIHWPTRSIYKGSSV